MTRKAMWIKTSALAMGLSACVLLAGGCQTNSSSGGTTAAENEAEQDKPAPEIDPKVGMTKDQIITMYQGKPDDKDIGPDGGEIWRYHMNAGQRWIPFNYGYHPEYDTIRFDKDGKVKQVVLNHSE